LNISIRHVQHFIAVAQELHFRRAAQLTNVAQPALSRSVQTLESELGVQLLTRNNRNVKLTAAGKEFLTGCTEIVAAMDSTINKAKRADQSQFGGVNIGYTYIAMCGKLPKLLAAFEQQHPDISVEPIAASTANQMEQLHRGELDCCFLSGAVDQPATTEIETIEFQSDAFVIIVNNSHPLAGNGSISMHELVREKILLSGQPTDSTFNQHVHRLFSVAGMEPQFEFVKQDHIGILGRVALGRGVCIATEGYGVVYSDELSILTLTGTNAKLPTLMAWRQGQPADAALKFREFVLQSAQLTNTVQAPDSISEAEALPE